jgi:hypothetical protein
MIRPSNTSNRGSIAKGCLIATGIFLVLLIGVGIWVAVSWKGWTATLMKNGAQELVQQSSMASEQKAKVVTRINGVADDFAAGKLTFEQLGQFFKAITEGPVVTMAMAEALDTQHIAQNSNFTPEEKADAKRTIQRVVRGVAEKSISPQALQDILAPISEGSGGGGPRVKQNPTPDDLRKVLAAAKTRADEAKVPDEPYQLDIAAEIDKAMAAAGVPQATPAPTK